MFNYCTTLSNWLIGYDRYQNIYDKVNIKESTYPNEFYLLKEHELSIGINKAQKLLQKLNIENNKIIRIETDINESFTKKNTRNGKGWVLNDHKIPVKNVYFYENNKWIKTNVEELTAQSFQLNDEKFIEYKNLKPLTFSFLPIAIACQASCLFCFSGSSISIERKKRIKDFNQLEQWCQKAKNSGAQRFVLTGGGEPTILPYKEIIECLKTSQKFFNKNIIITNGLFLSKKPEKEIEEKLLELKESGLTTLSLSYHHYNSEKLKKIMGLDTNIQKILEVWNKLPKEKVPNIRLICVLQKGGIDTTTEINNYINFAEKYNINQICFKELYVSSTKESLYSGGKENIYSANHQISLSVLINMLENDPNALKTSELPWKSPIYTVKRNNQKISIAAYTEPSVGWERTNGIARSWNYMSDQKCFATLEDEKSEITL